MDVIRPRAFTPAQVERLRPATREITHRLLDGFDGDGECEFMAAFADRYPIRVICRLFDVPEEDADALAGWVDALGLVFAMPVQPHLPAICDAIAHLNDWADQLIARRRAAPRSDLVSALVATEADGDKLDAEELRNMLIILLLGGHDTTRCQLGLALHTFMSHPDQWALLADHPEHAATAVEEVFRVAPNVPAVYRVTREEFAHRDLALPAGAMVLLCPHWRTPTRASTATRDSTSPHDVPHR